MSLPISLVEEVLYEILKSYSTVPSLLFFSNSDRSRSAARLQPDPSILSVSKQWLRVGQPLIYESIIIETFAQADALGRSLSACPENFTRVRSFRIAAFSHKDVAERLIALSGDTLEDLCFAVCGALCIGMDHDLNDDEDEGLRVDVLQRANPTRFGLVDCTGWGRSAKASDDYETWLAGHLRGDVSSERPTVLLAYNVAKCLNDGNWSRLASLFLVCNPITLSTVDTHDTTSITITRLILSHTTKLAHIYLPFHPAQFVLVVRYVLYQPQVAQLQSIVCVRDGSLERGGSAIAMQWFK